MKYSYIFPLLLISKMSYGATAAGDAALLDSTAGKRTAVVNITSYRHCYSAPLHINVVTQTRDDPAYSYRGPEWAAGISVHSNPFPHELKDKVISSKLLSEECFSLGLDHIAQDVRGWDDWGHRHCSVEITYSAR